MLSSIGHYKSVNKSVDSLYIYKQVFCVKNVTEVGNYFIIAFLKSELCVNDCHFIMKVLKYWQKKIVLTHA